MPRRRSASAAVARPPSLLAVDMGYFPSRQTPLVRASISRIIVALNALESCAKGWPSLST